ACTATGNPPAVATLTHSDAGGTSFAICTFTPLSLLSRNVVPLADTATVTITVTPLSRVYGFTVGPANLAFDVAGRPTVQVSYLHYADRTVYDSAGHYADFPAFELALRLWRQRGPDDWVSASDVAPAGAAVAAPWDAPGAGETDDPIGHLAQRLRALPAVPVPGLPRFTGGAVGYLGYDLVRTIERLPKPPADTLALPDAVLMIADTVVIIDNLFGRAIVVANVEVPAGAAAAERLRLHDAADARLTDVIARRGERHALAPLPLRDTLPPVPTASRYSRPAFERDVGRILEYIRAGDTFQTVLSRRQDAAGAVDPFLLYRYLRALNPAPYLFYLALD